MPANSSAQPMDLRKQVSHLRGAQDSSHLIAECARVGRDLAMTMAKLTVTQRRHYAVVGEALITAAASLTEFAQEQPAAAAVPVNVIAYAGLAFHDAAEFITEVGA